MKRCKAPSAIWRLGGDPKKVGTWQLHWGWRSFDVRCLNAPLYISLLRYRQLLSTLEPPLLMLGPPSCVHRWLGEKRTRDIFRTFEFIIWWFGGGGDGVLTSQRYNWNILRPVPQQKQEECAVSLSLFAIGRYQKIISCALGLKRKCLVNTRKNERRTPTLFFLNSAALPCYNQVLCVYFWHQIIVLITGNIHNWDCIWVVIRSILSKLVWRIFLIL